MEQINKRKDEVQILCPPSRSDVGTYYQQDIYKHVLVIKEYTVVKIFDMIHLVSRFFPPRDKKYFFKLLRVLIPGNFKYGISFAFSDGCKYLSTV